MKLYFECSLFDNNKFKIKDQFIVKQDELIFNKLINKKKHLL